MAETGEGSAAAQDQLQVHVTNLASSPEVSEAEDDVITPKAPRPFVWNSPSSADTRPALGRHVSSPVTFLSRKRTPARSPSRPSTSRRITSSLMRLAPGADTKRTPEWTVFGQLMENEGQLGRSPQPEIGGGPIRRRSNCSLASHHRGSYASSIAGSVSAPIDEEAQLETPTNVYFNSPVLANEPPEVLDFGEDAGGGYESESDTSDSSPVTPAEPEPRGWFSLPEFGPIPTLYRNILKCGIAYFIASLFTFTPFLANLISDITAYGPGPRKPSPAGHMVATVAVYFNPAKTMGGMVEADMFGFLGLVYASFVCLSSAGMFWWLETKPGWEWLADFVVIFWIGISMSCVAWMKVKMAKPSFNTACSMIAIIIFIVIVKEGGLETLLQVSLIILVGSSVSNLVCWCIWPQSAVRNLQDNMIKTLDSFSTLLQMLTSTFLLEEGLHQPSHSKLQRAVENHQSSFTSLKKNLEEAHSEWFKGGPTGHDRKSSGRAYEDAVDSLNRLAQHLNGLRSGTRLQYDLTKAHSDGKVVLKHRVSRSKRHDTEARNLIDSESSGSGKVEAEAEEEMLLKEAAAMFGDLVDDLGPPLRALTTTCTASFKRLREAFLARQRVSRKPAISAHEFQELTEGITRALFSFESTSNHALLRLYRRSGSPAMSRRSSMYSVSDNQMLIGGDNEHVFLVYFFIFTLQEFAQELVSLIDAMARIYSAEQARATRPSWWRRAIQSVVTFLGAIRLLPTRRPSLKRSISAFVLPKHRYHQPKFPKVEPHAPDTIQTPSRSQLDFTGRIKQRLWAIGTMLRQKDLKYAVKTGMALSMLAAPAFFDATRPFFTEYRGEWALISFFIVISPTIGATNFMSLHRIVGTLFGAGVAAGIYHLFPQNPYVLSVFGFFFSLPCFYYIVATPQYATSGRFVLLTYNLTALFCYNLRQVDVSPFDVALQRSAAVTVGVVWAFLVSRFWWPSEARRELSKALGEFCLNVGWLYTRLVAANSFAPEPRDLIDLNDHPTREGEGPSMLLSPNASTRLNNSIQEFMAMELHLQIKLIEIQGLLAQTQHEPRLKGPFPVALYRSILTSLQTILDKLHSMRCVTTREEWFTTVRQDFIVPVNRERYEMVGNIILSFSTLASAFRLKAPLPPYLPPAEKARQRLVDAIRRLDVVKNRDVKGSRQLLFFAYALTMKGVTQELDYLGRTLQDAFGVIGQTPAEFEALFGDQRRAAMLV